MPTSIKDGLKWLLVIASYPCHIPVWAALFASTASEVWLASNMLLAIILSSGMFVATFVWVGRAFLGLSGGDKPTDRHCTVVWTVDKEHEIEEIEVVADREEREPLTTRIDPDLIRTHPTGR